MAKVCEEEGADGISLVNTFKAMAIDINKKSQYLRIFMQDYRPAIKPIVLEWFMKFVKCKYTSNGNGWYNYMQDAIEFIMAGATCIQVGTVNFMNPKIGLEIIKGIEEYMDREGIESLEEIRGII